MRLDGYVLWKIRNALNAFLANPSDDMCLKAWGIVCDVRKAYRNDGRLSDDVRSVMVWTCREFARFHIGSEGARISAIGELEHIRDVECSKEAIIDG